MKDSLNKFMALETKYKVLVGFVVFVLVAIVLS